ncbi:hypothetical protein BMS3Abin06_01219 [bacterium BMS3Abin06]|nr:hypothetical protein BMS3Abin06_01219 [bacterium BMS3Abin06]
MCLPPPPYFKGEFQLIIKIKEARYQNILEMISFFSYAYNMGGVECQGL